MNTSVQNQNPKLLVTVLKCKIQFSHSDFDAVRRMKRCFVANRADTVKDPPLIETLYFNPM